MKNLTLIMLFTSLIFASCIKETKQKSIKLNYPKTIKKAVIDTLFGTEIIDNYRWLEDDRSEETESWVKAENEVSFNYLSEIPFREQLKRRLTELWNYEKLSAPFIEGDYTYFYKNDGLQNQNVIYRKKDGKETLFLDPNTFSENATTSLGSLSFSKNGKTVANRTGVCPFSSFGTENGMIIATQNGLIVRHEVMIRLYRQWELERRGTADSTFWKKPFALSKRSYTLPH